MPEINPPTPLKPLWPVRRDERQPEKKRDQPTPEREGIKQRKNNAGDDNSHVIDEFV